MIAGGFKKFQLTNIVLKKAPHADSSNEEPPTPVVTNTPPPSPTADNAVKMDGYNDTDIATLWTTFLNAGLANFGAVVFADRKNIDPKQFSALLGEITFSGNQLNTNVAPQNLEKPLSEYLKGLLGNPQYRELAKNLAIVYGAECPSSDWFSWSGLFTLWQNCNDTAYDGAARNR